MSVGSNIRKRRYELKMSQQDLADAMGYKSRTTIAKIELGENDITQKKLQKFARVMETTVEALLVGNDSLNSREYMEPDMADSGDVDARNVAIIMAGGKSSRNQQNIPNQFINVLGKPVIVYCMEAYQRHPSIDDIYVVCLKGWESIVKDYASQYHITKLKGIIMAGSSGIMSVKHGLDYIRNRYDKNDVIIIQESTRPMVSVEVISKLIQNVNSTGSASICRYMRDYVLFSVDNTKISSIDRNSTVELQSPEAFKLGVISGAFDKAKQCGHELTESCCAMLLYKLGYYINFIEGSSNNLKIIRQEDIAMFAAILRNKNE